MVVAISPMVLNLSCVLLASLLDWLTWLSGIGLVIMTVGWICDWRYTTFMCESRASPLTTIKMLLLR